MDKAKKMVKAAVVVLLLAMVWAWANGIYQSRKNTKVNTNVRFKREWTVGEYRFCQNEPVPMSGLPATAEPLDCGDPFIDDSFVQNVRNGQNALELPTHIFDVEFKGKVQSDWRCRREADGLKCEAPF